MLPIEKFRLHLTSPRKIKNRNVADHDSVRLFSLIFGVNGPMPTILDLPVDKKEDDGDYQRDKEDDIDD